MSLRIVTIWRRVRELSRSEWLGLMQATVAVPLVVLALKTLGLRRTQGALGRISRPQPPLNNDPALARRLARMVGIAGRFGIIRPNCLQRSLVLWTMLRRRHMEPFLRIGVAPPSDSEGLRFHAWIELADQVVNDSPDVAKEFKPFESPVDTAPGSFDR